ncbi:hypothetical protein FSP39_016207 [Pinctada imbricata]|uniref:peptidylprolyl isomerase n=1 Tax=Pinctada imbricata TaxID=66713 RepID=A0AA89C1F5_PINIB|nr:hypothetical protein FSP39_016207 [Pinctada imbricata]
MSVRRIPALIVGHSQTKYFHLAFSEECNVTSLSFSGYKIEEMWKEIETYVSSFKIIVLHVGANNLQHDSPPDILRKYQALVTNIRGVRPDCLVIISGILPRSQNLWPGQQRTRRFLDSVNAKAVSVNASLRNIAKKTGYLRFVDHPSIEGDRRLLSKDGLHLSSKGMTTFAVRIYEAIKSVRKNNHHRPQTRLVPTVLPITYYRDALMMERTEPELIVDPDSAMPDLYNETQWPHLPNTQSPAVRPTVTQPPPARPTVTQPPAARPTATQPPVSQPPAVRHTVTKPPASRPPVTRAPVTQSPAARPPMTRAPVTQPPAARPTDTQPSAARPTATQPPAARPTATQPPAARPTASQPPAVRHTVTPATRPTVTQPSVTQPPAARPTITQPPVDFISKVPEIQLGGGPDENCVIYCIENKMMDFRKVIQILDDPSDELISCLPPLKPKAGEVYLLGNIQDATCDQYQWVNKGCQNIPKRDPVMQRRDYKSRQFSGDKVGDDGFRRIIYFSKSRALALVHYLGDENVAVELPHGNAVHRSQVHKRTLKSTLAELKGQSNSNEPQSVYRESVTKLGVKATEQGVLNAKNKKQIENIRYKQNKEKKISHDSAYNTLQLAYNLENYVIEYALYPELRLVLACKELTDELNRLLLLTEGEPVLLSMNSTEDSQYIPEVSKTSNDIDLNLNNAEKFNDNAHEVPHNDNITKSPKSVLNKSVNKDDNKGDKDDNDNDSDSDMPPLEDRVPKEEGNDSESLNTDSENQTKEKVDPETLKENDVEDECYKHEDTGGDGDEEEYMDILGNGLLKRKVLKEGESKASRPIHGDVATIKVSGKLADDTAVDVIDSVTFTLGDGDVIQAWDLAVALMNVGQVIELITDARYAYGELGRDPDIPGNATITYTIELLSKDYPKDLDTMAVSERLELGEKKRERGNYLFSRHDYVGAINSYSKAVKILDPESVSDSVENLQQLLENRLKCYNNMAACQLKTGIFDAAKTSCRSVLDVQPDNVKALFRMGKACAGKGETKDAVQYMRKAQKLEPDTKIINQELFKLTKKLSAETESERNMYQKMLGTKATPSKSPKKDANTNNSWVWPMLGAVAIGLVGAGIAAYRHIQH